MPRNPQGLYTLPLPPVVPGELIEADWANPTLDDIASALTGSLPRNGSAPMMAPLTLSNIPPSQPRHAIDKAYLDNFLAYATGMPVGAVMPVAGSTVPPGFLLCDGQAVSRTTYPALFSEIGVIYGAGDGATTFNVPDMRDWFVRGRNPSTRTIGSTQQSAFAAHSHPTQDPGHNHPASQAAHGHDVTTTPHSHGVTDAGHSHPSTLLVATPTPGPLWSSGGGYRIDPGGVATTGISIQNAAPTGAADQQQPAVTVANGATGIAVGATGGDETRPQNIAMNYVIKAIDDASATVALTGITSSDDNCISINNSNPVVPQLDIKSNVAFGTVKLDASGQIPLGLLPSSVQQLLGYWDASGGQTPSQNNPAINYASGDTYVISVGGTLTVYDPVTLTASPTSVAVGSLLQYIENSLTSPTGWYYVVSSSTVVASQVAFSPAGTIGATNVQAAIEELDSETQASLATKVSKSGDTMTGLLVAPAIQINGDIDLFGNVAYYNAAIRNSAQIFFAGAAGTSVVAQLYRNSATGQLIFDLRGNDGSLPKSFVFDWSSGDATKLVGGPWAGNSDARMKNVLGEYTDGLDAILAIRPVRYEMKSMPDVHHVGILAQDLLETPLGDDCITEGSDGFYQYNGNAVTYALVNAVKELSAKLDAAVAEIAALKADK